MAYLAPRVITPSANPETFVPAGPALGARAQLSHGTRRGRHGRGRRQDNLAEALMALRPVADAGSPRGIRSPDDSRPGPGRLGRGAGFASAAVHIPATVSSARARGGGDGPGHTPHSGNSLTERVRLCQGAVVEGFREGLGLSRRHAKMRPSRRNCQSAERKGDAYIWPDRGVALLLQMREGTSACSSNTTASRCADAPGPSLPAESMPGPCPTPPPQGIVGPALDLLGTRSQRRLRASTMRACSARRRSCTASRRPLAGEGCLRLSSCSGKRRVS